MMPAVTGWDIVPITPFLAGQAFEPDDIKTMSAAFVSACETLHLADRADPLTEIVAAKIIELMQRGIRDPDTLLERTLRELNSRVS